LTSHRPLKSQNDILQGYVSVCTFFISLLTKSH